MDFTGLPDRKEQIIATHADLILAVVTAVRQRGAGHDLTPLLQQIEQGGASGLARALRAILSGQRDPALTLGLDEPETVIVETILEGLRDPGRLGRLHRPDPALAGPGLAALLEEALTGAPERRDVVLDLASQMEQAGGPLRELGGVLRRILAGEREPEGLIRDLSPSVQTLVAGLLATLPPERPH